MRATFVTTNVIITLAYVVFGVYIAPRFSMLGPGHRAVMVAKYAILLFFVGCAMTHAELALHVVTEPRQSVEWMLSWHMIIGHVSQAVAALVGTYMTARFLQISVLPSNTDA